MTVRVSIMREIEVEVDNPVFAELDTYYREHGVPIHFTKELEDKSHEAIKAIEKVVGLPFGDEYAPETIVNVMSMDGEAIIEW